MDTSKAPFVDSPGLKTTKDTCGFTFHVKTTFMGGANVDNAGERTKVGVAVAGVGLLSIVGVKIGDHK